MRKQHVYLVRTQGLPRLPDFEFALY